PWSASSPTGAAEGGPTVQHDVRTRGASRLVRIRIARPRGLAVRRHDTRRPTTPLSRRRRPGWIESRHRGSAFLRAGRLSKPAAAARLVPKLAPTLRAHLLPPAELLRGEDRLHLRRDLRADPLQLTQLRTPRETRVGMERPQSLDLRLEDGLQLLPLFRSQFELPCRLFEPLAEQARPIRGALPARGRVPCLNPEQRRDKDNEAPDDYILHTSFLFSPCAWTAHRTRGAGEVSKVTGEGNDGR